MKRGWLLYRLLTKRLLKRPSFWLILFLVPLLSAAAGLLGGQESHLLSLGLYVPENGDRLAAQVASELLENDGAVEYKMFDSGEELRRQTAFGQIDGGYLFPEDFSARLQGLIDGTEDTLVTFVAGEDTPWLKAAREQFFGAVFPHLSRALSEGFALEQAEELGKDPSETVMEMEKLYEANLVEEELFSLSVYGQEDSGSGQGSYLTAPLRGFLALFVFLAGLAMAMFLLKDKKEGVWRWLVRGREGALPWLYILTGTLIAGFAAFAGLMVSRTGGSWYGELLRMLLLVLAVTGFSTVLAQLISRPAVLGACIPVLILAGAVLCPVFLTIRGMEALQYLLPPYFYLAGTGSARLTLFLALYAAVSSAAGIGLAAALSRRR